VWFIWLMSIIEDDVNPKTGLIFGNVSPETGPTRYNGLISYELYAIVLYTI
jgi:hypothetical protein